MRLASICTGARTPSLTGRDGGVLPVAKGSEIALSGSGESNFRSGLACVAEISGTSMSDWWIRCKLSFSVSSKGWSCEAPEERQKERGNSLSARVVARGLKG